MGFPDDSVPQHREYIRSGYSSEPIIAEAATRQMLAFRRGTRNGNNPTLNTLAQQMDEGLFDRGELGELTGRLLLMAAYDRAVEREHRERGHDTPLRIVKVALSRLSSENYSQRWKRKGFSTVRQTTKWVELCSGVF